MQIQTAVDNFVSAMRHCDNLIAVHRASGTGGPGRRTTATSVNRGTIVLTVAAWQAFVQDVAHALSAQANVELAAVQKALSLAGAMSQWNTDFDAAVEKFSTPGPEQTRALLMRAGFDPKPAWTWTQRGGQGRPNVLVEPKHVAKVISQWLRVRHDIAHGHATIHALPILSAVRDPKASTATKADPTLRLTDAIDCVGFFRSVVLLTGQAAARHIGTAEPSWHAKPALALGLNISEL